MLALRAERPLLDAARHDARRSSPRAALPARAVARSAAASDDAMRTVTEVPMEASLSDERMTNR